LTSAPNRSLKISFAGKEPAATSPMISLVVPINRQVQSYEVFLPATATFTNARIVFQLDQSDQMMWLDNVELHRVNATPVNSADMIRFEYNDTETNRVVTISDGNYIDPRGTFYLAGSTVTLLPYQSVILMKLPGTTINLLSNGGFEQDVDDNRQPDVWQNKIVSDDKVKCNKPTKSIAQEGKCALAFKGSGAMTSKYRQKLIVNGLGAPQTLTLNAYVKGKKAQTGGLLKLRVKYTDGSLSKGKLNLPFTAGTYDYTLLTDTLSLTGSAAKITVGIQYASTSGKVWIDDVQLLVNGTGSNQMLELPQPPLALPQP
jgi:hypothetical protein